MRTPEFISRVIWVLAGLMSTVPIGGQQSAPFLDAPVQLVPRSSAQRRQAAAVEHRITMDVVVTDSSGRPVSGLEQKDFTILDNARPQQIDTLQAEGRVAAAQGDAPPSETTPAQVMLVLDTLNNSFENVAAERKGIADYLAAGVGPLPYSTSLILISDRGAIVGKPSRDRQLLLKDLQKLPTPIHMIGAAEGFNGALRRFSLSVRLLMQLTAYAAALSGKKLVLWIGPGWPMLAGPSFEFTAKDQRNYFHTLVDVTNDLRRARVTLYDLETPSLSQGTEQRRDYYKIFLDPVRTAAQADSGYLALPVLALKSGGQAQRYSDSIPQSIASSEADADAYYMLSYASAPAARPDEYRSIEVRVNRPGIVVRTNAGYYAQP